MRREQSIAQPQSSVAVGAASRWSYTENGGQLSPQRVHEIGYTAAIVTYRRPESLRTVLDSLLAQRLPPQLIVVADNDPDRSAEAVVASTPASSRLVYVPVGTNSGPAGGWAAAVEAARTSDDRGSFVAVFDDDDPITDRQVMNQLVTGLTHAPDRVAAIGLRGATINRLALLHRSGDTDGAASADYLASNGAPLYRWSAVDELGFFDASLFFGFEDLDLGLRLRANDREILVSTAPTSQLVLDTAPDRTPWREYYKTRAMVVIAKRHLGPPAVVATVVRSLGAGIVRFARPNDKRLLLRARFDGVVDGLRERMGPGDYSPGFNPAKSSA